jgi:hypothetical protein
MTTGFLNSITMGFNRANFFVVLQLHHRETGIGLSATIITRQMAANSQ